VLIADFVDPVCLAVAAGAAPVDPTTPLWVKENADKLHTLVVKKDPTP
jgi:hypothetical protein